MKNISVKALTHPIMLYGAILLALFGVSPTAKADIFFPADLADLAFHIDAYDVTGTGSQPANGALITQWNDLSGNAYHFSALVGEEPSFEETGFDSLRPAIRFSRPDRLQGPDILPTVAGEMTIFFVMNNVTNTSNFSVSLNGNNNGTSTTTGRYSFHTPWSNGDVYFDAGGCCGATRLQGPLPNPITETSIYSAQNDLPGSSQTLRVDGGVIDADNTGHAADSTGGIVLGSMSGRPFDGRFGELIVYSRVLTLEEIEGIEEYLFCKWKPMLATEICANITAEKTVGVQSSPFGDYSLPGSFLRYTIAVENEGPFDVDAGTVKIADVIPDNTILKVSDIDAAGSGPVRFTDGSPSSGLSYNYISLGDLTDDVEFSNDGAVSFGYIPTPDGLGLDENVTHIRILPKQAFTGGTQTDPTQFSVQFDVYLE